MINRRTLLFTGTAALAGCMAPTAGTPRVRSRFEEIRAALDAGARLGVAALDTANGRRLEFDAHSRYAMCSTFKAALAGAILARADSGGRALEDSVPISRADLVDHAPVVAVNLQRGRMRVEELCAAIVEVSDNAAANILLRDIGGPAAFTAFARRCGDQVTRLDRMETELNTNIPGDPRDTTTAAAMLGLMRSLLLGNVLAPASRARLAGWMEDATTGRDRLRAGFPVGWRVGDKTGTANGANNDIAFAVPPGRAWILVASYIDARAADNGARNAAHAAVTRLVAETFA
jgi:beta-lactamase class A